MTQMNNYFISPAAEQDIDEIGAYIATENPKAAEKFIDNLYHSMEVLADNPMMGHKREDLTQEAVRFWPFKWHYYLIVYKSDSPVEIIRVLSGYRNIINLL